MFGAINAFKCIVRKIALISGVCIYEKTSREMVYLLDERFTCKYVKYHLYFLKYLISYLKVIKKFSEAKPNII